MQYFSDKAGSPAPSAPSLVVVRSSSTNHQEVRFRDGCWWVDMPGERATWEVATENVRSSAVGWQWEFKGPLLTLRGDLPYPLHDPINHDILMETAPPPLAKPPATVWPKSIGIIAIVFGIGGLFQAIMAPFSLLLVKPQMQTAVNQGGDQARVDEYLSRLAAHSYLSLAVHASLGLLLLAGGIFLIKRRKIASPLLQTWSILKILAGGFVIFRSVSLSTLQMQILMEPTMTSASSVRGGGGEMEMIHQITTYAMWAGLGFGFLWLAILPVFFIIWFNRRKVIDQVKTW